MLLLCFSSLLKDWLLVLEFLGRLLVILNVLTNSPSLDILVELTCSG